MKIKSIFLTALVAIICLFSAGCTNDEKRTATINADDDIIMTIYAYDGAGESRFGLLNLGHSFLSFENKTSEAINIGRYELAAGDIVTISTWSISEHFGIWYNTESNYIKYHNKYDGRYSVSVGLKKDCLDKLAKYIKENDEWLPTKNCTNFSVGLWNTLCDKNERVSTPLIYTPSKLTSDIKSFNTYEKNKAIPVSDRFGYYDENNNFVTLAFEKALKGGANA